MSRLKTGQLFLLTADIRFPMGFENVIKTAVDFWSQPFPQAWDEIAQHTPSRDVYYADTLPKLFPSSFSLDTSFEKLPAKIPPANNPNIEGTPEGVPPLAGLIVVAAVVGYATGQFLDYLGIPQILGDLYDDWSNRIDPDLFKKMAAEKEKENLDDEIAEKKYAIDQLRRVSPNHASLRQLEEDLSQLMDELIGLSTDPSSMLVNSTTSDGSKGAHSLPEDPISLFSNGISNIRWFQIIADLKTGDTISFSNGKKFKVERILSDNWSGMNALIISIEEGKAIRIPRYPDQEKNIRSTGSFKDGWREVSEAGIPTVRLFEEESYFPEYQVVEYIDVEILSEKFFKNFDRFDPTRRAHMLERFYEFAETTWLFSRIGDFHERQVAFSTSRDSWILIDFDDQHHRANAVASNYNAFQSARILGGFGDVPEEDFRVINQRINKRRIANGLPPSEIPDYVPPYELIGDREYDF